MFWPRCVVAGTAGCLLAAAACGQEHAAALDPLAAGAEAYALAESGRQAALARQFEALHLARWLGGLPPLGAAGGPWAASPRVSGAWTPAAGTASLEYLYAHPGGAGAATRSPWPRSVFEPWPIVPGDVYGWPYYGFVVQPSGHRIVWWGANAYTYEPVYETPDGVLTAGDLAAEVGATRRGAERAVDSPGRQAPRPAEAPLEELPPPASDAEARYQRARIALAQARYGDAVALLTGGGPAASDGRHALLLGHARAALGQVELAAEAIRMALAHLPQAEWGMLVADFRDVYADPSEFQRHLRTVERHVSEHPRSAQGRFLLGYLYGFLGYRPEAAAELEQVLALRGDDELARQLLRLFQHP
jgi:tetratricopeptide (TPR) repeat protein